MNRLHIIIIAGLLTLSSCSSSYETTQLGGLTIAHPKKTLNEYAECNVPALGNYYNNLMQKQGLQSLNIKVKNFGPAIFIYFPVQQQALGSNDYDMEFANAVANTKSKVYNNDKEVFMFLCDDNMKAVKLIGDRGLLMYENGKTIDITEVEVHNGYVYDCWESKLLYKDKAGRMEDEAGERLHFVVPDCICLKYNDYSSSIYAANSESLFEMIVASVSVEGNKHDTYLCLSYYYNAGKKDYLANIMNNGANAKPHANIQTRERQTFKLTSISRVFEDELLVVFTQLPSGQEYSFTTNASTLNGLKANLTIEVDGEVKANPNALKVDYVIAFEDKEVENENTGDMEKVRVLTYISEQN